MSEQKQRPDDDATATECIIECFDALTITITGIATLPKGAMLSFNIVMPDAEQVASDEVEDEEE